MNETKKSGSKGRSSDQYLVEKFGTCRLCLAHQVELCKSHIFPEFLYRELYDDRKSFFVYTDRPNWRPSIRKSGIYERLLCSSCEALFNRWETYACSALFNGLTSAPSLTDQAFIVSGVRYAHFKLFFLSLIWRAGVSNRIEFENVKLHQHEERLRSMLQRGYPGEPYEYPCALYVIKSGPRAIMSMPESIVPVHGHGGYRATMAGMSWAFFLSKNMKRFPGRACFLNEKGDLPLNLDADRGLDFLRSRVRGY